MFNTFDNPTEYARDEGSKPKFITETTESKEKYTWQTFTMQKLRDQNWVRIRVVTRVESSSFISGGNGP